MDRPVGLLYRACVASPSSKAFCPVMPLRVVTNPVRMMIFRMIWFPVSETKANDLERGSIEMPSGEEKEAFDPVPSVAPGERHWPATVVMSSDTKSNLRMQ